MRLGLKPARTDLLIWQTEFRRAESGLAAENIPQAKSTFWVCEFRVNDTARPAYKMANRMAEGGSGLTIGAGESIQDGVSDEQAKLG